MAIIKKAFDQSKLTKESKIRLSLSKNSKNYLGVRGDPLPESFILPEQQKSEKRMTGANGQLISMIRDTPTYPGSGHGAQTGAGSITLGVGYNFDDPSPITTSSPQDAVELLNATRDNEFTAAEIVIAQKKDVDIQLIKFFKSEYGSSWKLELDKYLLKNEDFNDQKAA